MPEPQPQPAPYPYGFQQMSTPEPFPMPIFMDTQLGQELIKVRSKIAIKIIPVEIINKKTGEVIGYEFRKIDTPYKEILTEDITTGFLSLQDCSVATNLQNLCAMIKSYGESYDLDLSEGYNLPADCHNALVITSKSMGEGAKISKSQFVEQKNQSYQQYREEGKQQKFFGLPR